MYIYICVALFGRYLWGCAQELAFRDAYGKNKMFRICLTRVISVAKLQSADRAPRLTGKILAPHPHNTEQYISASAIHSFYTFFRARKTPPPRPRHPNICVHYLFFERIFRWAHIEHDVVSLLHTY